MVLEQASAQTHALVSADSSFVFGRWMASPPVRARRVENTDNDEVKAFEAASTE